MRKVETLQTPETVNKRASLLSGGGGGALLQPTFEDVTLQNKQLRAENLALKIQLAQTSVGFAQAQSQLFHYIAKEESAKLQALQAEARALDQAVTPAQETDKKTQEHR